MNEIYALLAELAARGEPAALATVIRTDRSVPRHEGSKMVVLADGRAVGSVGGGPVEARVLAAARATIADGRCRRVRLDLRGGESVCGGEVEVFVEPVTDAAPCWVLGAGHVGRAVALICRDLPLRVTLVVDRADLLAAARAQSGAAWLAASPYDLSAHLVPTARTLVLCATRGHELDAEYLAALFAAERAAGVEVAWTGLIGSRAKAAHLRQRFTADPATAARWARVATPVGLAIGAETPAELAVSIAAEMLAVARGAAWLPGDDGRPAGLPLQRSPRPDPPPAPPEASR